MVTNPGGKERESKSEERERESERDRQEESERERDERLVGAVLACDVVNRTAVQYGEGQYSVVC